MTTTKRGVSTLLAVLVALAFPPSSASTLPVRSSAQGFAIQGASVVSNNASWIGLPHTRELAAQDLRAPTLTPSVYFLSEEPTSDRLASYVDNQQLLDALIAMMEPFRLTYRPLASEGGRSPHVPSGPAWADLSQFRW